MPTARGANISEPSKDTESEFFPKGSIAFFIVMLVSFALIWLGMYFVLLHRQAGL